MSAIASHNRSTAAVEDVPCEWFACSESGLQSNRSAARTCLWAELFLYTVNDEALHGK